MCVGNPSITANALEGRPGKRVAFNLNNVSFISVYMIETHVRACAGQLLGPREERFSGRLPGGGTGAALASRGWAALRAQGVWPGRCSIFRALSFADLAARSLAVALIREA
jgi:hypothetical protein